MEITHLYGNVLVIHSEPTEMVGILHKSKNFAQKEIISSLTDYIY